MAHSPAPALARIRSWARESATTVDYSFDNRARLPPDMIVLQRTLSGEGFFRHEGGSLQTVPEGHLMLFRYHERSSYGFPAGASKPYCFDYLNISGGVELLPLFEGIRISFGHVVKIPPASAPALLFDQIGAHFHRRSFVDLLHESELLFRLLIALYREQIAMSRQSDPIEFGRHYLQSHHRSLINLKEVADRCGISREHFIRRFTARFGESPGASLRRLRLEHARTLLLGTNLLVEEVAAASGFSSANAFARAYRQHYGTTPSESRRASGRRDARAVRGDLGSGAFRC